MNEHLRWILAQVNEWLKFAEAKNGALVVADIALMVGIWQMSAPPEIFGRFSAVYFSTLHGLLGTGAIAAALSFLPVTEIPRQKPRGDPKATDNLLYFGDIAKHTAKHYVSALERKTGLVEKRDELSWTWEVQPGTPQPQ